MFYTDGIVNHPTSYDHAPYLIQHRFDHCVQPYTAPKLLDMKIDWAWPGSSAPGSPCDPVTSENGGREEPSAKPHPLISVNVGTLSC